jgi:phage-related protein
MKPVRFLGDSRRKLQEFPRNVRQKIGYQLERVQRGLKVFDSKPMPQIGKGVEEIRVWEEPGTYRIVYTARMEEALYVLHTFQKKTQTTLQTDIELARRRFRELMGARR